MYRIFGLVVIGALLSGCAQFESISHSIGEERAFSLFRKKTDDLSDWHYESFPYCSIQDTELEEFALPFQPDLWARIRDGFTFPDIDNERVQRELNLYATHPTHMTRVTERGTRYLYHIAEQLQARNMPMELALLPIVESAFDPFAYSHGRASGMWQVIPGTGEMLGLKQNWWYDGRRDVVASTDAALNYLEQMHKRFDGDWELALAAYNSGAGNVSKAIRKNKKLGKPIDYWSLDLPNETKTYVPRLLALKELIARPEEYGLQLHPIPNDPYFAVIDVGSQIDLARAAELAGLSMGDFNLLNPGFNRWATDPEGPHQLLVPASTADAFRNQLAELPSDSRVSWDRYTIRSGDTLSLIAKRYNTNVEALQAVNDLNSHMIHVGKTLMVPLTAPTAERYAKSFSQRHKGKQSADKPRKVSYTVQSGDSLWSISRRYKTSIGNIAKWNTMAAEDPIRPGQVLTLWTQPEPSAQTVASATTTPNVRKVNYKVRQGDSLARIASKFNLQVTDIVQWNTVNPRNYLQPGDLLTLFVDVTNAR